MSVKFSSHDSVSKILDYLNRVAKEDIVVDGKPFGVNYPTKVTIANEFFLKDSCTMCGRCCLNATTVWTDEGWQRVNSSTEHDFNEWGLSYDVVAELNARIVKRSLDINGKMCNFYISPSDKDNIATKLNFEGKDKPKSMCHWLIGKEFDGKQCYVCSLHPIKSVTCAIPHLRFYNNQNTRHTVLRLGQYGRNWALGCPIKNFEMVHEPSVQDKIKWLTRLNAVADDLGIKTFLPEILKYLNSGARKMKVFTLENSGAVHHRLIGKKRSSDGEKDPGFKNCSQCCSNCSQ